MLVFKPQKLAKLLEDRGIKPTPFSLELGSNRTLISDILKKKSSPTIQTVLKIANKLNIRPEFFWDNSSVPTPIIYKK